LYELLKTTPKVRAIFRDEKKFSLVKRIFSYYTQEVNVLFSNIEWIRANINDLPLLETAFTGVKQVYHCAAYVSFEPNKFDLLKQTNIEGTANIVNLCISYSIKKLCYVSSIATLGKPKKNKKINETTFWNPDAENNIYGISKYGAELEVWRGIQEGVNAVIVNPGVIIGPGIWEYGSGSIYKQIYKGLSYYPSGSVGCISVNDVVSIMIRLMKSTTTNDRFILVAENLSYKTLIYEIAKYLNVKPPKKQAPTLLLSVAWKADWLKHKLTGSKRILSKDLLKILSSKTTYDHTKIKEQLDFKFTSIKEISQKTAKHFLKVQKS